MEITEERLKEIIREVVREVVREELARRLTPTTILARDAHPLREPKPSPAPVPVIGIPYSPGPIDPNQPH